MKNEIDILLMHIYNAELVS